MPSAATLEVQINSTLNETGFERAEQRVQGLGSRLGTALGTAGGFLLANAVQAVASNIGQLASEGLNFEAQMANVNSIAQLSAQELQQLSDQVLQLAQNPGITQGPAELAAGLYNIASSGFAGADGLQVLEASAIAATAGLTSSETAATAITAALNAYGLEADSARSVSDILFQTVNEGVITFDQLANNLGNTLAPAASLGVGLEELGAAYARLTLSGVQASQAETQIAALMRSALNPTEALTSAVQAQGYASAAAAIEAEGMSGFLKILTEASGGSQEELFNLLGTTEAMNAALLLGGDNLDEYIESVTRMGEASEGAGATQTALNKQMQSASFRIAKMRQQLQVAATMFMGFLAPGISAAAEGLTRFISGGLIPFVDVIGTALRGGFEFRDAVDALPEPLQRTAGALGSVFEAVGDVVRAFGDRGLSGAIRTLTDGGELAQIGSAFAAIGQEAWNAAVAGIQAIPWGTLWDTAVNLIPNTVDLLFDIVPKIGQWLWDRGSDLVSWAIGHLGGTATRGDGTEGPAGTNAASTVDVVLDLAAQLGTWVWGTGSDLVSWAKSTIEDTITIDNIKAAITVTADTLDMIWGGFSEAAGWVYSKIEKSVTVDIIANFLIEAGTGTMAPGEDATFRDQAKALIEGVLNPVPVEVSPEFTQDVEAGSESFTQQVLDLFRLDFGLVTDHWQKFGAGLALGLNPVGWMGQITSRFAGLRFGPAIVDILAASFQGASEPIIGAVLEVGLAIEGALETLVGGVRNKLNAGGEAMRNGWNSLKSAVSVDIGWLTGPIGSIVDAVTGMVGPIEDAWGKIKPIWDFLFGGGGSASVGANVDTTGGNVGSGAGGWSGSGAGGNLGLLGTRKAPNVRPVQIPPPDTTEYDRVISDLPTRLARGMASATQTAQAGASLIGSVIGSGFTQMVGTVTGLMGQFSSVISSGMVSAQGVTASASGAIVGIIGSAFAQVVGIVTSTTGQIPGIIAGNLAAAASAAYSSGLAIGQGLAAGMNASLGQVRAAADALAAEATRAAQARLQVASPSRVFEEIGQQVGDGFVRGMQSRYGAAGAAGQGLAGASIPTTAAAAYGRRGASGNTVVIVTPDSEHFSEIARKARRGGDFAELLPQLLKQGAY